MLEGLDSLGLSASDLGAGVLLSIAVLAILRGWIVPRKVLEDIKLMYEARLTDAQEGEASWREAWATQEQRALNAEAQVRALLQHSALGTHAMQALQQVATGNTPPTPPPLPAPHVTTEAS